MNGFLVIDKPLGVTSRDAVNQVQRTLPRGTRIGHTGTLDPLATGVLVVAIGQATRLADYVQRQAKEYRAGVFLGATSATDDAEGPITPTVDPAMPTRDAFDLALAKFVGTVEQTPPDFSAAHVDGRRAYKLARKGQAVELASKTVRVDGIDVVAFDPPNVELIVRSGKGVYIRSIARDLGRDLGCGAYLTSLRRTRVGPFHERDATPPGAIRGVALRALAEAVIDLKRIEVSDEDARRLSMGQRVPCPPEVVGEAAVFDPAGRLCAIVDAAEGMVKPTKVFLQA